MNTLPVSAFKQVNKKSDEKTKKRKRQVDSPVIHETPKIKKLKLATDESPVVKSNLVGLVLDFFHNMLKCIAISLMEFFFIIIR